MKCPKCGGNMEIGKAIETNPRSESICFQQPRITYKNLQLIDCFKCVKCGYSDDGINPKKLVD